MCTGMFVSQCVWPTASVSPPALNEPTGKSKSWLTETIWNSSSESHRVTLQSKSVTPRGRRFTHHRDWPHTHTHTLIEIVQLGLLTSPKLGSLSCLGSFKEPLPGFYEWKSSDLSAGSTIKKMHHVLVDSEGRHSGPLVWLGLNLISSLVGKFKIWCFALCLQLYWILN